MTSSTRQLPIVWAPEYEVDIGPHVFPTIKYRLVKEQLERDGVLSPARIRRPEPATREALGRVHTPDYLDKVATGGLSTEEERKLEVPFSDALRTAFLVCCGGTALTGRLALEQRTAVHLGGGFHHAFPDHGEGFCLLNDVAVGLRTLVAEGLVERAAVVDLDVHHGNGTAVVFQDDPGVFTFSMHQESNYPMPKPPGDLDVGLPDGTDDEAYLALLGRHLPAILDGHRPQLVLYLAGADPYREDQLGGLSLTLEGLRRRDRLVFETCRAARIPVGVTLAGGYAIREADTVAIHVGTVHEAVAAWQRWGGGSGGGAG